MHYVQHNAQLWKHMLNTTIEKGVLKSLIFIQLVKSVSLGVICHSDFTITKEIIPNYIC